MRSLVFRLTVAAAVHTTSVTAVLFTFVNRCPFPVKMWDNTVFTDIPARTGVVAVDAQGSGLMWRHGYNPQATLAEVTVDRGRVWYDISVIPPGTGKCASYDECQAVAGGRSGFNVALAMVPQANIDGDTCRALICLTQSCDDAYLYPYDNLKVHNCPDTTPFDVIFCPGGIVGRAVRLSLLPLPINDRPAPDSAVANLTHPPMPRPGNDNMSPTPTTNIVPTNPITTSPIIGGGASEYVRARFEYRGAQAGNVPGSYNRVTNLETCARQRVDVRNPVGPLSEEITVVFRGPMEIHNIAVFAGTPDAWPRLSWYAREGGGRSGNLVFLNNKNVDYSGRNRWGPQSFASLDGNASSPTPTPFGGSLADATNVQQIGGGPGVDTGVEVNIMTAQPCSANGCRGFSDGAFNYRGWGGDRKVVVTRVQMPMSGTRPNLPGIWMLNAQAMYTGQYNTCNCRGMGAAGGCGELDIAEVIENQNPQLDRISTHHYFYDGAVPNPPRGDNYATRPTTSTATYVTIMDATVGDGLIKIVEVDDGAIDFTALQLTTAQVQNWINA